MMGMTVAFFVLLAVIKVEATPIQPDIGKVVARPTQNNQNFAPARAGWDGSEMPANSHVANSTFDQLGPASTARHVQQALFGAFVPDYRAVAGILLVIMLLRRIVVTRRKALAAQALAGVPVVAPTEVILPENDEARRAA